MVPEIGQFALILALCLALLQSVVPLVGVWRSDSAWSGVAVPAARAQALMVAVAFAALTYAFIEGDFSVAYVAQNSNSALPMMYRIAAVWGAHEGSMLLWALTLAGWTLAVTIFSAQLPEDFRVRVVAIMGLVSVGFLLFILWTSNPFLRLLPAPLDGNDLNPLLQDPGMAIHPPLLYMGYVGLSVPFAFAIAALLDGHLDAAWLRWTRPWCIVAWLFLTLGITIGSWWAYNELGWGGWWFWDPVENASFMPWLIATALMHSLAVTEQRGAFKAWTVLLAIFGFSLSLLGTFLVRSGVLVSVHAFATDPARGTFILIFLALVVGGSLLLYAWRAGAVSGGGNFDLFSRETLLLVNNVVLTVASASVLLGTLYPLIMDTLGVGKISVGPPYFERVFVPLMLPLIALLCFGPLTRWKRDSVARLAGLLRTSLIAAVALGAVAASLVAGPFKVMVMVALFLAAWVTLTAIQGVIARLRNKSTLTAGLRRLPRAFIGMTLAHLGIALFVVGVALTSAYSVRRDVSLAPGQTATLAGYDFLLVGLSKNRGPNYTAQRAEVRISRDGRPVATLYPQKRSYLRQSQPMTEAAIDPGVTRDLYVALGAPLGDNGAWALRLYYKPFIRWLWFGPLLMALGGLLSASDRRYRLAKRARALDTAGRGSPRLDTPAVARS